MGGEKEKNKNKNKKQKHQHPNHQSPKPTADFSFKLCSEVKGLRFGGQFVVKSFTIRRARPLELLRLLSLPPPTPPPPNHHQDRNNSSGKPNNPITTSKPHLVFPSTAAFLPTNFTILAHHAWHTLTLGLGTKKSKVLLFVFESEGMRAAVDRLWPAEIPLGEVNRKLIRAQTGSEMARFKFRKGCVTFYVYAVRRVGSAGFACADDLRTILQSVVALKDFLDHTAMLAMPHQRTINYSSPPQPVAMAH
ncbi:uncharacterized protein LOC131165747 [Malania oleifera]|uniref:uncharacterized protein LOC131165747 n=1 Tax=Malania oleifera TaxID=397392 RepID=UPI0025AD9D99|nr:uncharacterized protein LOC131165747 [Malania oleifera]